MVARTQGFHLPSQTSEQVAATFPQNAAPVRGLSNFGSTRSRPRQVSLLSYKACKGMLDHTRARLTADPLNYWNSPSFTFSTTPHTSAGFKNPVRCVPHLNRYSYLVTRSAEPCATARAQDFYFSFQSEKPSIPTLLQNAAPVRGLSSFSATYPGPRQPRIPSYTACKNVRGYSCSQLPVLPLREEDSQFSSFLGALQFRANFIT